MRFQLTKDKSANLSSYGALELKASYQKNLGLAVLISSVFFLVLVACISSLSNKTPEQLQVPKVVVITDLVEIGTPPSMIKPKKPEIHIDRSQILAGAKVGLPEPVPDEQVEPEATIPTQDQLLALNNMENKSVLTDDVDSIVFEPPPEQTSQRAEFIPHTEEPFAINKHNVPLIYPELALRAGIEGTVYVAALVDKNGNVKDAYIKIESEANAGFEEAALEQALKLKYRPAFNNRIPVELWIIYRVDFKLK
ncbi:MAG: energy transducer TonB [Candidatus Zixiibacteriota bacterium]